MFYPELNHIRRRRKMDYPRMSERNEPNAAYKVLRRRLKSLDDDIPDDKTRLIPGRNLIDHLYKECENL